MLRESRFEIDTFEGETFEGFSLNQNWNGWACPYFTHEQAQRVVDAHRARGWKAWYDEVADSFAFDFSHDGLDEIDAFPLEEVEGQKLYPIGAGCWIWEETTEAVAVFPVTGE